MLLTLLVIANKAHALQRVVVRIKCREIIPNLNLTGFVKDNVVDTDKTCQVG